MKNKKVIIISFIILLGCIIMGIVDVYFQPLYWVKSIIKIALFFTLPLFFFSTFKDQSYHKLFKITKRGLGITLILGIIVYGLILGAYFIFKNVFDFSNITISLTGNAGVSSSNFIWVALYISFANSFLEEFFFRGFSFLTLKKYSSPFFAYSFSALCFAFYHVAMMIGWFSIGAFVLALLGLTLGALIFNYLDVKFKTIYPSWIVHMFANFAINTIGLILFNII